MCMLRYSAIGTNTNGGKYDNAVMMTITPKVITPNVIESTLKVPADSGTYFLLAINPTIAIGPIIGIYLSSIIINPCVTFQKTLLPVRPARALPLLALGEVTA